MKELIHCAFHDRAQTYPTKIAYTYYQEKENISVQVTNKELDLATRKIAQYIKSKKIKSVILILDEHDNFIKAFLACLYAGVIAIPLARPNSLRPWDFIEKITKDVECTTILTMASVIKNFNRVANEYHSMDGFLVDIAEINIPTADQLSAPLIIDPESIAFIQYTSGSTGFPKGVQVSHANILFNLIQMRKRFGFTKNDKGVIWLPPYHDMGLIGGILQPLYTGFPVSFIPSVTFIKSPIKWLRLITEMKATVTGGPNFAFDLCVDKITKEQCEGLDISSLQVVFNGAEKVRYESLKGFETKFSPYGFQLGAFAPCYGMAEATLIITGIDRNEIPLFIKVDKADFLDKKITQVTGNNNEFKWLVSSGKTVDECEVVIVDPKSLKILQNNEIGEIWASGKNISSGYWNRPEHNETNFGITLTDDDTHYLKTGDLGFINQDHVFITGRLKELIIFNGKNYYPQDIERSAIASHPALNYCNASVFSIYDNRKNHLFIIQEVKRTEIRNIDPDKLCLTIQKSVAADHGIRFTGVFLVKPNTIAQTSSGKIQRFKVKKQFKDGKLNKNIIGKKIDESVNYFFKNTTKQKESQKIIYTDDRLKEQLIDDSKANQMIAWLRDYANNRINSQLMDERRSVSPNIVLDFGNQGLFGMQIPKQYGGLGMSFVNTLNVFRQLSSIDLTLGMFVGINHSLGTRPIVNYAKQDFKEEILPRIATGRELSTFAFTEPAAGSNPRGIRSIATSLGNHQWQINGQKEWIGLGSWSTTISTFAHIRDKQGKLLGITGFALRQGDKGLVMGPEALTMGVRSIVQNKIFLNDVTVSENRLLGELGEGMEVAQDVMAHARFGIGCACLGGLQKCAQIALTYSKRRNVSTGNLLENPLTLFKLSKLTAIIPAAEALLFGIGALLDEGFDVTEDAFNACKIILPELLWEAIDDVSQLLGGRGYIESNIIPQMIRDARILRVFEGPTETLQMYLGSQSIYDTTKIVHLIKNGFKSPEVANRYTNALDQIKSRMETCLVFSNKTKNNQWFYLKIGEISAYAIMLAAIKGKGAEKWLKSPYQKSIDWVDQTFEQLVKETLSKSIYDNLLLSSDQLVQTISSYSEVIGDLEQTLAGEENTLDPFLKKKFINSFNNTTKKNDSSIGLDENEQEKRNPISLNENLEDSYTDYSIGEENLTNVEKESSEIIYLKVKQWIENWVINKLNLSQLEIDNQENNFFDLGMDSLTSVDFVSSLESWLKIDLDTSIVWNFPTIESLSMHIAKNTTAETSLTVEKDKKEVLDVINPSYYQFEKTEHFIKLKKQLKDLEETGISSSYFSAIQGMSNDTVSINEKEFINYSGYNYLGLSGDSRVLAHTEEAIRKYGTSVSASRVISGEIPLHSELENLLCETIGFESCLVFTGGHATNVSTIGHLFNKKDLVIYDSYIHSSILEGAKMSGATRIPFPHNDLESLDQILSKQRQKFQQVIIIVEGVYSMDGDIIDLMRLIELKKQYKCYLMVDEAHSFGVIGEKGFGISTCFPIKPKDVDIWMGTLSKSLASCGGYIGGSKEIIDYMKFTASGFIYSAGITPANTAAAIAALRIMKKEPQRVKQLISNADLFRDLAKENGLDIGLSKDSAIVPIILGETEKCLVIANSIRNKGINVVPIIPPTVPENEARIRFFINTLHTSEQIRLTIKFICDAINQYNGQTKSLVL